MIRLIPKNEIDEKAWNSAVHSTGLDLPYAFTWYLNITCANYNGLILDDYEAVMPLPFKKKMGVNYLYQPFFSQQLGIYSAIKTTDSIVNEFVGSIPQTYKYIDLYFNETNNLEQLISRHDSTVSRRHTSHLNLSRSYEAIYKGYNSNTKRNLKKAKQSEIEKIGSIEELIEIFKSQKTKAATGLNETDYKLLKKLSVECLRRDIGQIEVIKIQGEIAAGIFYIKLNKKIIWLFPVLNNKFKEDRPLFSLTDQIIKKYADTNHILDFEGSMIPNVQRIYDGFGADKISYSHLRWNRLPWYIKWIKK